jgi:hypothetical protein
MTNVVRVDFRPYAVRRRQEIIESYAPFGAEFERGLADYEVFAAGGELRSNPYSPGPAQAEWDRGWQAGMHIRIATAPITCQAEAGVAKTFARYRAKQIVKQRLADRGVRLAEVTARDVTEWAEALLAEQPELIAEAVETVRQRPELQKLVRARMRMAKQWRKATTE